MPSGRFWLTITGAVFHLHTAVLVAQQWRNLPGTGNDQFAVAGIIDGIAQALLGGTSWATSRFVSSHQWSAAGMVNRFGAYNRAGDRCEHGGGVICAHRRPKAIAPVTKGQYIMYRCQLPAPERNAPPPRPR